tara:strand:+ start:413 stop:820 length:408 start_codon:yes stop_codon:yes gene_type:complete
MITRIDKAGVFGNPSAVKAKIFEEAATFASTLGKVAIPISFDETTAGPGRFASFEYQFRVISKDDPEYKRVSLQPRADQVFESKSVVDVNVREETESLESESDLYNALLRLDDLRSKGILTEIEFQKQKTKLLGP